MHLDSRLASKSPLCTLSLQAETAMLLIPELDFEVQSGTLGGRFTTVEGLLVQARDQLTTSHPFLLGDSVGESESRTKMQAFLDDINKVRSGRGIVCVHVMVCLCVDVYVCVKIISGERLDVHVILDDPAGNSYIQVCSFLASTCEADNYWSGGAKLISDPVPNQLSMYVHIITIQFAECVCTGP